MERSFILPALERRFRGPGASDLYDLLPSELDAHAAASTFVRRRHPSEVSEVETAGPEDSCPRVLLSRLGPEPLETLPERTVYYALMFRKRLDEWAAETHGTSFGEAIDVHMRGAAAIWRAAEEASPSVTPVPSR